MTDVSWSRDSSVSTALCYGLDDRGSTFRFPAGAGNVSLHYRVPNDSGAHPASYPMGTRGSFPGAKRPDREADHSSPSSAGVKNAWSYTSAPKYVFMAWCLVSTGTNSPFYIYDRHFSNVSSTTDGPRSLSTGIGYVLCIPETHGSDTGLIIVYSEMLLLSLLLIPVGECSYLKIIFISITKPSPCIVLPLLAFLNSNKVLAPYNIWIWSYHPSHKCSNPFPILTLVL
jgi:hypothetical protein